MAKYARKVAEALKARQDAQPKDVSGYHYIKAGSQNRKKGYGVSAPGRGRRRR